MVPFLSIAVRPVIGKCVVGLVAAVSFLSSASLFAAPYQLPDAELLTPGFTQIAGYSPSTSALNGKFDVAGAGVSFFVTLAGSDSGKLGISDPWPTDSAAGFGWDPTLGHWTSLASFGSYRMTVGYFSGPTGSDIDLSLIMNTGLTGPSGFPSLDPTNDTFWAGPWVNLPLGESVALTLDFAAAQAFNIADNKSPHTGGALNWPEGGIFSINDRDLNEISNIGFQIADFDGDALGQQLTLNIDVPEPATILLVAGGILFLSRRRAPVGK
jgi:hypothetical protein